MWLVILSYVCGSIPFGLLIVRLVAGVDLRTVGSGNIGATNAGRIVGKTWGIIVLLLDALKGAGPTLLAPWFATQTQLELTSETAQVYAAAAAVLGHMFPIWLGFRGGKGVATALGAVLVLAPIPTLIAAVVFALVFAVKRIVSLGSILAALTFTIVQLGTLLPDPWSDEHRIRALFALTIPVLILVRHAGNIARLIQGTEPTFTRKSATTEEPPESE